jgi:hypothetical protein
MLANHRVEFQPARSGVHPVLKWPVGKILGFGCRKRLIWVADQSNKYLLGQPPGMVDKGIAKERIAVLAPEVFLGFPMSCDVAASGSWWFGNSPLSTASFRWRLRHYFSDSQ